MKKFEFILKRNIVEKGWLIIVTFFLSFIPSYSFRLFVALVLLSYLLPKDIEDNKVSLLLSLPLRRWEIFLFDFIVGVIILCIPCFITAGITKFGINSVIRLILAMPFIYGISVIFSTMGKGNFAIPFLIIILDISFGWSRWIYVSPLYQHSIFGMFISIFIFVFSFIYFNKEGNLKW